MSKIESNKPVVMRVLRKMVADCGNQRDAAKQLGVTVSLLNRTLTEADEPPPKILAALGYERITFYRKVK